MTQEQHKLLLLLGLMEMGEQLAALRPRWDWAVVQLGSLMPSAVGPTSGSR